jgi:hypothetical protein
MSDLARNACSYAERGWSVIPLHSVRQGACTCGNADCTSPGKHPYTKNGSKDGTTNAALIDAWWRHWPKANVGVCSGARAGIVATDVDPRHGGDESLLELVKEHGELSARGEEIGQAAIGESGVARVGLLTEPATRVAG